MSVVKFSVGFALLAATACSQLPATPGAGITVPAQVYYAPAQRAVYEAQTAPPANIQQVAYAPTPTYTPLPQYISRPEYNPAPQYTPAPSYAPTPTEAKAAIPQYRPAAQLAASRPAAVPASLTSRRFVAIDSVKVAELSERSKKTPFSVEAPDSTIPGLQITTAAAKTDPFSISTSSAGKPYYESSTPPAIEYHIPHIPQEEPLWCWAAAAQQAIGWVNKGRAPAQCAIVALAHGMDVQACCADREGICARTGEIPAIAKLVKKFGGEARELAIVPRDPKTVYDILARGETLLIRLRPAPHDEAVGIRHMIVVRGVEWLRLPNNQLQATLLYNDPLGAGERAVNFDEIEGFFEQALVIKRAG